MCYGTYTKVKELTICSVLGVVTIVYAVYFWSPHSPGRRWWRRAWSSWKKKEKWICYPSAWENYNRPLYWYVYVQHFMIHEKKILREVSLSTYLHLAWLQLPAWQTQEGGKSAFPWLTGDEDEKDWSTLQRCASDEPRWTTSGER